MFFPLVGDGIDQTDDGIDQTDDARIDDGIDQTDDARIDDGIDQTDDARIDDGIGLCFHQGFVLPCPKDPCIVARGSP